MQAYAEAASKAVAEAENALRLAVDLKSPDYESFEPLLEKLRKTSQDYVFLIFPAAAAKPIEDRLWDGHVRVNKKFQKHLKQFREGTGKKKHVERRKAEKHYLHFIKASMHFYRGYIQRLASHFGNVPELNVIADKLHLDTLAVDPAVSVANEQQEIVLSSCHNALMRLGDLSRYRETELETKNRNWGPAKGHYQLALSVRPESGAAYNQLAVMALADEDHLRAVYYLHRAAATTKPFPVARDNIKLEFEKLLKVEPEEKPAISDTSKQTLEVLENRFLTFHANCHSRPSDFVTYSEKATQMLQLITVSFEEITDRTLDKLLQKMCLISIVAEHLAWTGISQDVKALSTPVLERSEKEQKAYEKLVTEHERNSQAVYLLQRFNIMVFTTLLKMLARELIGDSEEVENDKRQQSTNVSPVVQRLLPHLRQYSSWLLSNIHSILNPRHASTGKCLELFWKAYIKIANLLLFRFPISEIADLDYLLEEDKDTLSFAPFSPNVVRWRYYFDDGMCKPVGKARDEGGAINSEMLARIRRFVFDAATITNQKEKLKIEWAPIELSKGEFVYLEKPVVLEPIIQKPSTPSQPFRSRAHAHASSLSGISPVPSPKPEKTHVDAKIQHGTHKASRAQVALNEPAKAMEKMEKISINRESQNPTPATSNVEREKEQLFNSSSILTGTPNRLSSPVNIMDIVRSMQQKTSQSTQTSPPNGIDVSHGMPQPSVEPLSPSAIPAATQHSRLSNPSIPGVWSTPFTPRPGETPGPKPVSGTLSGGPLSATVSTSHTDFFQFLKQQERNIQLRTSPYEPPALSSWPEPPMSPGSHQQLHQPQTWKPGPSSPWQSPSARSPLPPSREIPQTALFGAIGEPRKNRLRTLSDGSPE